MFQKHGNDVTILTKDSDAAIYYIFNLWYNRKAREMAAIKLGTLYEWNGMGYLLRKGIIDRDTGYTLCNGVSGSWLWLKFEPAIREMRVRYNMPDAFADLEYLAMEMMKEAESRGYSSKAPERFAHYTGKDPQ